MIHPFFLTLLGGGFMKKIFLILVLTFLLYGCQERTMRYTASNLESNIESTSWTVSFDSLEGHLQEGFIVNPVEYPVLEYDISLASGEMLVEVTQDKNTVELPLDKGTLDLSDFREGSIYLNIRTTTAKNAHLIFRWLPK